MIQQGVLSGKREVLCKHPGDWLNLGGKAGEVREFSLYIKPRAQSEGQKLTRVTTAQDFNFASSELLSEMNERPLLFAASELLISMALSGPEVVSIALRCRCAPATR